MDKPRLQAAILIISDTAFQDPSTDKAGDILSDVIAIDGNDQWDFTKRDILPDDVLAIQHAITQYCDGEDFVNLLITTGGTGFAVKDNTPEAVTPLLHRHAPGLVHGMLQASLEVTPFALMSRPVAGVRSKTLIVTLPGSPKGAKENLQAILRLMPHACQQAAGGDSRKLHTGGVKKLEEDAGVSGNKRQKHHHDDHVHSHDHTHNHGGHVVPKAHTRPEDRPISNDPRAGPTSRYRNSPYAMLPVEDAVGLILANSPAPETINMPVNGSLVGYVLAEDVKANDPVPAYRASIVDGYAVIVSENGPSTKGMFPVASISHAAPGEIPTLQRGQIARITTGAPLPPGANSVVMVEDTVLRSMTDDSQEEKVVEILTDQVKADENIREIGSDIKAGEVVLRKGEEITAVGGELGLLASVGKAEVMVYRKPVIGVLSTGDEIVMHDRPGPLQLGEVRDCNRPTLMAAIKGWGFQVVDYGIAKDKPGSLEEHLRNALRDVDVIVTSGGVSMGELDLLKPTVERSLGGKIHFGRVNMKPGKPTTFATVPLKTNDGNPATKLVFSLPGNPASALVTSHLFVLPSLQYSSGKQELHGLPRVKAQLEEDVRCDPKRPEYHRVSLTPGPNGLLHATSTGGQRSSKVTSLRQANGLLCLPAKEWTAPKGEVVDALLMGGL
ncbi:hypothetical protein ABVK25_003479 [Lepraria finkii]|uniref:MoaB/Mog domain-containing protein n=1 Tax=Lepraria finkii TaxID=1340010 RepID=A0ABR4BFF1_9LECA